MAEAIPLGEKAFLHDVFISYSRIDSAFVAVLEKALRRYKPPKDLLAPQGRLNVFRDTEDFTGTEYSAAVALHLHASHKMIVICSPNARASQWVNDEIRRFVQTHPAADIIPVIIAGIPNNEAKAGNDAELAFPQALVEQLSMPLASDYRGFDPKSDRDAAGKKFKEGWYKLLADIYGCSRAEVEQRERNRVVQDRIWWTIASSVILTTLGAALLFAWHQDKTAKSEQFAAQSMQQGDRDPEQALQLARKAIEHRDTPLSTSALRLALAKAPDLLLSLTPRTPKSEDDYVEPAAFALTPDRTRIAVADKSLRIVELKTGGVVARLDAGGVSVTDLRFSPDGVWLAAILATSDEKKRTLVFDLSSSKASARIDGELFWRPLREGAQTGVVLGDKSLEIGGIDSAGSWRASKKLTPRDYPQSTQDDEESSRELSPDGRRIATLATRKNISQLTVTDLDSGKSASRTLPAPMANKLVWSPKGAYLVAPSLNGFHVVEPRSLKTVFQSDTGHDITVEDVRFSPDEKLLATTNRSGQAILWDIAKKKKFATFAGPPEPAIDPVFSPDGAYVGVRYGVTNRVLLFALEGAASSEGANFLNKPSMEFSAHWGGAQEAGFTPDGNALLIQYKRKLALWKAERWQWQRRLPLGYDTREEAGIPQGLQDIQIGAEGSAILVRRGDGWRGWSALSGAEVKGEASALKPLQEATLSESGDLRLHLDATDETTVYLENRADGSEQFPLQHNARVMSKTFSPNGSCILTTSQFLSADTEPPESGDVARLWDTQTGAKLREWSFGHGHPDSAFFSAPDRIVVLSAGKAFVYETPLCEPLNSLRRQAQARVSSP